jgi:hypothetical protein
MEEPKGSFTGRKDMMMSNQPNNRIQQTSTPEELQKHLPTETHASAQAVQELSEEQLENVAGGSLIGSVVKWGAKKALKAIF